MPNKNKQQATGSAFLDSSIPIPLYYQLKQAILERIQEGEWLPGDTIPTEKELEVRYRISRITVRRALGELAAEGYISRRSGRGSFLLKGKIQQTSDKLGIFFDDLANQGIRVQSRIVSMKKRPAPRGVAKKLAVEAGSPLESFVRLAIADGEPIALSTTYLKFESHIKFTRKELAAGSMFPLLEQKTGIRLPRADKTIEATVATAEEAKLLKANINSPLLLVELTAYTAQNEPVLLMKAIYRGDRYKYFSQVTR